jgi:hypothetical protein
VFPVDGAAYEGRPAVFADDLGLPSEAGPSTDDLASAAEAVSALGAFAADVAVGVLE